MVVTRSHRNLTYALVSNLKERGRRSCMVCHQNAGDEDFIDTLSIADGTPFTVAANRRPRGTEWAAAGRFQVALASRMMLTSASMSGR